LHGRDTRRRRAHREVALDVIAVRDDDAVVAHVRIVSPAPRDATTATLAIGGQLSLLLVPTQGGTLFLVAREGLADATTLTITGCP
jgi:hypothetical protein